MLQAISLSKAYGTHLALSDLNLEVKPGEIFSLLGQNGAGKTTTINIFLGFLEPTSGKALIDGDLVSEATRKCLAYIPEVVMLYSNFTAIENLAFFSRVAGFKYSNDELSSLLSKCGLQVEAHHKKLANFSKGMRQKVGIAIAVSKNATTILMDEPTSGLDPKATNEFTSIVKQLAQEGRSVLMATHDIFNAVNVASTIGIMRQGKLVHVLNANEINANDLQQLYLETI